MILVLMCDLNIEIRHKLMNVCHNTVSTFRNTIESKDGVLVSLSEVKVI